MTPSGTGLAVPHRRIAVQALNLLDDRLLGDLGANRADIESFLTRKAASR